MLLTLSNKYDFKPSSIIDLNLGSFIFPVIKDHGLPTPSSNKTQPPGSCNVKIAINFFEQYLESEEMQNPVPDKLTSRSKGKMTNLYVQYCHTVTDRREQLTDRSLCANKLMWKSRARPYPFLVREVFWGIQECRKDVPGRVPRFPGSVPGFTDILSNQ